MASEPLTIDLSGDVSLDVFAEEMRQWRTVLEELAAAVGMSAPVQFSIAGLRAGSALAMVSAESEDEEGLARMARAYMATGRALRSREPLPFPSQRLARAAHALIKPLLQNVVSVRFETADEEITVGREAEATGEPASSSRPLRAYGSVTGRIQTLTSRNKLAFTLFDVVFDRAVTCYLRKGQEDLVRDKWDQRATVHGIVSRDPFTGRPTSLRQVRDIVVEPDAAAGDFRQARGLVPFDPHGEPISETLKRLRDAW